MEDVAEVGALEGEGAPDEEEAPDRAVVEPTGAAGEEEAGATMLNMNIHNVEFIFININFMIYILTYIKYQLQLIALLIITLLHFNA